ncbi:MAG TPA: PhzF family phenazine biosynthesis protein [Bacteroidota bacterium]|nr:PhzF family phenazine biosynthesis protein [Bacteroidota bacterium]
MKTLRFKQIDAFTTKAFSGNYAGVVFHADGLTDEEMQLIAREVNLPETAFILQPTVDNADLRIRWFTPTTEVPLCGHATIAAFYGLAEDCEGGMGKNGQHYFQLQTKSGILPVMVEKNFCSTAVEFELPCPKFSAKRNQPRLLLKALGIASQDCEKRIPIVSASYIYIPVRSLRTLQSLHPDFRLLERILRSMHVGGVSVFTFETLERASAVHSRFFAPHQGINEDPVTGSANGPLGAYIFKYALPAGYNIPYRTLPDGRLEFIHEQGDSLDRAGRVKVRLQIQGSTIERVTIVGEAKTIINGTISI